MTSSRLSFRVALIVAGFLLAQSIVVLAVNLAYLELPPGLDDPSGSLLGGAAASLIPTILRVICFGLGVFVCLRFVIPLNANETWKRAIVAGVIATILGAVSVVVLGLAQAIADSVNPGTYPFGYSFAPTVNAEGLSYGVGRAFESALDPLINWVAPVVLATVLLKVWLSAQVTRATVPASVSAKP